MPHYIQWESLCADIITAAGSARLDAANGSQFAEGMYQGLMLALIFSNDPKHNPPAAGAGLTGVGMMNELRAILVKWQALAGNACDKFEEYKGGRYCYRCDESDSTHEAKRCADQLSELMNRFAMAGPFTGGGGGCYSSDNGGNGASGSDGSGDHTYRTGGGGAGVGGSGYVAVAGGAYKYEFPCECGCASVTIERAVVRCAKCGKPFDLIQLSEPLPTHAARSDPQR